MKLQPPRLSRWSISRSVQHYSTQPTIRIAGNGECDTSLSPLEETALQYLTPPSALQAKENVKPRSAPWRIQVHYSIPGLGKIQFHTQSFPQRSYHVVAISRMRRTVLE